MKLYRRKGAKKNACVRFLCGYFCLELLTYYVF
jgi:hypothetical protein